MVGWSLGVHRYKVCAVVSTTDISALVLLPNLLRIWSFHPYNGHTCGNHLRLKLGWGRCLGNNCKKFGKHKMFFCTNHTYSLNIFKSSKINPSVDFKIPLTGGLWTQALAGPVKTVGNCEERHSPCLLHHQP